MNSTKKDEFQFLFQLNNYFQNRGIQQIITDIKTNPTMNKNINLISNLLNPIFIQYEKEDYRPLQNLSEVCPILLQLCFQFLTDKELALISTFSKRWKTLSESVLVWKYANVHLKDVYSLDIFPPSKSHLIQSLGLSCEMQSSSRSRLLFPEQRKQKLKEFVSLKNLTLYDITEESYEELIIKDTSFKQNKIESLEIRPKFIAFDMLTNMLRMDCPFLNPQWNGLQTLVLFKVNLKSIKCFSTNKLKLKKLVLFNFHILDHDLLPLVHLENLETLHLSTSSSLIMIFLFGIASKEVLKNLSEDQLEQISIKFPAYQLLQKNLQELLLDRHATLLFEAFFPFSTIKEEKKKGEPEIKIRKLQLTRCVYDPIYRKYHKSNKFLSPIESLTVDYTVMNIYFVSFFTYFQNVSQLGYIGDKENSKEEEKSNDCLNKLLWILSSYFFTKGLRELVVSNEEVDLLFLKGISNLFYLKNLILKDCIIKRTEEEEKLDVLNVLYPLELL